jgi:hypothetical protein
MGFAARPSAHAPAEWGGYNIQADFGGGKSTVFRRILVLLLDHLRKSFRLPLRGKKQNSRVLANPAELLSLAWCLSGWT